MADQSVRACHPSKFYYLRRSLLISCCYILSPFISRPPPSALPSRIPITLRPSSPPALSLSLSLVLSLVPLNSFPVLFHLFSSPCYSSSLYSSAGSIFDSRRDEKKIRGGGEREKKGGEKSSTSVLLSAREIKQRRNLEHVCSGFAAAASSRRFTSQQIYPFCLPPLPLPGLFSLPLRS